MFIATLFIIVRSWKEPRCLSTEEWIEKMWYIYTMEYYSAIKNNDFMKFTTQDTTHRPYETQEERRSHQSVDATVLLRMWKKIISGK